LITAPSVRARSKNFYQAGVKSSGVPNRSLSKLPRSPSVPINGNAAPPSVSRTRSTHTQIINPTGLQTTLEYVRSFTDKVCNWVHCIHNNNTLMISKTGIGLQNFIYLLKDDAVSFVYFSIYDRDSILPPKTVFLTWMGPKIKIEKNSKRSTSIIEVQNFFKPYDIEITCSNKEYLIEANLQTKIMAENQVSLQFE